MYIKLALSLNRFLILAVLYHLLGSFGEENLLPRSHTRDLNQHLRPGLGIALFKFPQVILICKQQEETDSRFPNQF